MNIVTKNGDQGMTRDAQGKEMPKNALLMMVMGEVDELNGLLGVARLYLKNSTVKAAVREIQEILVSVLAELAGVPPKQTEVEHWINGAAVDHITEKCEALSSALDIEPLFIIPGDQESSAFLDYARAIARRCERTMVALDSENKIKGSSLAIWMNRLSDYLWLLARQEEAEPTN